MRFALALLMIIAPADAVRGAEQAAAPPASQLALQYDFSLLDGGQVTDLSGNNHHGRVEHGEAVYGRRRMAIRFADEGQVSLDPLPGGLNPHGRALAVGAWANPAAADGVLVSMGGRQNGFSLHLKAGVPHFAVRSGGVLAEAAAPEAVVLDQWVHLLGIVGSDGKLALLVGGWPVASAAGATIVAEVDEPFTVGADRQTPVGAYASPQHWRGQVEDVRLYWGEPPTDEIKDWLNLAGCGCRPAR